MSPLILKLNPYLGLITIKLIESDSKWLYYVNDVLAMI